jgi:hypothetical protein
MGWLRNKKRTQLKNDLIKQGKLDQYAIKFERQIKQIDDQIHLLDLKAKEAYQSNDDYETRLYIYQIRELKTFKNDIQKLLALLNKAALKKEAQDMYQTFLEELNQFKEAYRLDKNSKRSTKKTLRKYQKEALDLDAQMDWIDEKINKIDKKMDKKENMTDKSLSEIDIEAYMQFNE